MNSCRARGFTLVELLLAVTLMSVLLALAYGGLRAATQSSERGQETLEQTSRLRITHQFVRRQFNLMLPLAWQADPVDAENRVVFEGGADFVQFVAPMPGYLGSGGPHVQRIELLDGSDGNELLFSHALLQDFQPERLQDRDPVVLLEEVRDARFEFLELDDEGLPAGWVSEWRDTSQLPVAVRLDLDLGGGDENRVLWPTLVASARLDPSAVSGAGARATSDYSSAVNELIRRSVQERQ